MRLLVDPVAIHILEIFATTFLIKAHFNFVVLLVVHLDFSHVFEVHGRFGKLVRQESEISQGVDTFAVLILGRLSLSINAAAQSRIAQHIYDELATGIPGAAFVAKLTTLVLQSNLKSPKIKGDIEVAVVAATVGFDALLNDGSSFGVSIFLSVAGLNE